MTQRELIDYCNACEECSNYCKHKDACERYEKKFGDIPYWDDMDSERYTEEEV